MEYLYSGTPIVSTFTSEYKDEALFEMSESNNDWPLLFKKTLASISAQKEDKLVADRIRYALENTYEKQIDRIEGILIDSNL